MLDRLQPQPGSRHRTKRVGRGPGSGHRKTSGRGIKGQGKRSAGREVPIFSEGGQMPLTRRLPKRGFRPLNKKQWEIVNVGALAVFGENSRIDVAALVARGLIRGHFSAQVKLLGDGDVPRGLTVQVHGASASARKKLEEAGGTLEIMA